MFVSLPPPAVNPRNPAVAICVAPYPPDLKTTAMQQAEVVSTSLIVLEPDLDIYQHMSGSVGTIYKCVRAVVSRNQSGEGKRKDEKSEGCFTVPFISIL